MRRSIWIAILPVTFVACGGGDPPPPKEPAVAPTAQAVDEPKNEDYATLDILCEPSSDVLVDGKKAGKTPVHGFKVTPGKHDVTFVDEQEGNRTMTIEVSAGEGKTVISDKRPPPIQEKKVDKKDDKKPPKK